MLDEVGKLKYPPKLRRVEVKKADVTQARELPVPGIVKLHVSYTFASHVYLNSSPNFCLFFFVL
jgi:hypothetical protein